KHPLHRLYQAPREGKSETGALDPGMLGTEPLEGNEQLVHPLRWDAGAGVPDAEADPLVGRLADDPHLATFAIVLDRVGEEVEHHLSEPLPVGVHVEVGIN